MNKFRFTGDPRPGAHNPREVAIAGIHFALDGPGVEVPEPLAERLRRNNHFTEVRVGRPPKPRDDDGSA